MLFATFILFYSVTVMGNLVIVLRVYIDKCLQTPMYYFLDHLCLRDADHICSCLLDALGSAPSWDAGNIFDYLLRTTVFVPVFGNVRVHINGNNGYGLLCGICNPLRYTSIMNSHTCLWVVIVSWVFGFLFEIWPVYVTFHLTFCKSNVLDHFYCDRGQLFKLSCDDSHFTEFILFLMAVFVLFGSLIPTIVSYTYIVSTILKIPTASGRRKAFSTCASHFTFVVIGYGSCLFLFVKPKQTQAAEYNRVASLMVLVVTSLTDSLRSSETP